MITFLLALIAIAINIPSLFYKLTGCDDMLMISNANALLKQSGGFLSVFSKPYMFDSGLYYRPVVMLSFFPDLLLGGSASVFHASNLVYFSVSVILVYLTLLQLKIGRTIALAAACLFAVNPVYTNAVAWIPGRNDILLTVFSLAFFILVLKYFDNGKILHLVFAIVFLLLALFTKESAAIFALFVLGFVIVFPNGRTWKFRLSAFIAVLLCTALWFFVRKSVVTQPAETGGLKNGAYLVQALGKVVFPYDLTVLPTIIDTSWIAGIGAAIFIFVIIVFIKREDFKLVFAGLAMFIIMLAPVLININPEYSADLMLECRLMLPSVGVLIAVFGSGFLVKIPKNYVRYILFTVVFVSFCFFNVRFSSSYSDEETFWKTAVIDSKHLDLSFAGLGLTYLHAERWQEAETNYIKAAELNPSKASYNGKLGYIKLKQNDADGALKYFLNELKINRSDYESNLLAGIILFKKGELEQSKALLLAAMQLNQADYQPAFYLMKLSYQQHDKSELNKYVQIVKSKGIKIPDEIQNELK